MRPLNLLFLLVPPIFWAGNAVVGRMAAGTIPPLTLNFVRWFLALLLLLPFVWTKLKQDWPLLKKHWRLMAITAFLSITTYNALQYLALTTSSAINITLITSAGPIFTLLIGRLFFGASISRSATIGAVISIFGVAWVLVRGDLDHVASIKFVPGDLFMLVAVALWALYAWVLRKRPQSISIYSAFAAQIMLGSLFAFPMMLAELSFGSYAPMQLSGKLLAILLYVVTCPALLAYICWQQAVARTGTELPMFFQNLTPIFAALLSVALLGEHPEGYHVVALALIVLGILLANRKQKTN